MKSKALHFLLVLSLLAAGHAAAEGIENATFTTVLIDGKPADYESEIPNTTKRVYFYAEVDGLEGKSVKHRWSHEGKKMAEVAIEVSGERMPTTSHLDMQPTWTGTWTVDVLGPEGEILSTSLLNYIAPL